MLETGPFASVATVENIHEKVQHEAEAKLEALKKLTKEKLQYEELEKENKMLRSELHTMEADIQETEETKRKLREEAGELMKTMVENKEQAESKLQAQREEVRELQVKLSNLRQTGKQRGQAGQGNTKNTVKRENPQPVLPLTTPARRFHFKRK